MEDIVGAARNLRAELKLDPKEPLEGALYSAGRAYEVAEASVEAISALARVKLELHRGGAPKVSGAMRATPAFDLSLNVSETQLVALKARLVKEIEQLGKNILSLDRQLGDEGFVAKAPEHVVGGMREKLAEYNTQLAKSQEALGGL